MYDKVAIFIDAFIRNKTDEDFLLKNILQIKKLNLPILLISNSVISKKIQESVDYFFYDSVDLKFVKKYEDYEDLIYFSTFDHFKIEFLRPYTQPYGLSVMSNHYKSVSILNSIKFEVAVKLEWDVFYDDRDIENIKKTITDFKVGSYNQGYFQCGNPPSWIVKGTCVEPLIWIVSTKFFLENFPKLLCEDDYDNYLINTLNDRSFLTDSRFLYKTLVEKFTNNGIVKTDPNICPILYSKTEKVSPVNYPKPCTTSSLRYLFKNSVSNDEYVLFSNNISTLNPENPNWETINYRIETKYRVIELTHTVNTGMYRYHNLTIYENEFPINLCVNGECIKYTSRNQIEGTYIKY